jgi:hypothetical protein
VNDLLFATRLAGRGKCTKDTPSAQQEHGPRIPL